MQTTSRRLPRHADWTPLLTAAAVIVIAAALVILPPILSAVLIVGAVVATIVVVRPLWGFYLLLFSIPAQDLGAVGELTATNVLFGLTVVAWLLRRLVYGGKPLPRTAIGPIFAIFVGGLTLSLIVARELTPGIAALFQWVKSLAVFFLALDFLRTRRQTIGALLVLLAAGAAEGTVGLVQYLTGIGPASFAIGAQFSRAFGTFGRPNSYAGYLEMLLPIGLVVCYLVYIRRATPALAGWRFRVAFAAAVGATGMIAAALFASYSRGAWLGTLGALVVMILAFSVRTRVTAVLGVALLALILLAGGANFLPQGFSERVLNAFANADTPDVRTAFITPENFSTVERRAHWEAGLQMFASNRLLGVGLGNFNVRFAEFTVSPTFRISQGHAHNYYIHVAAEAGLVGLVTYLLLLATIVGTGLRALWLTSRPGADPLARAIVIGCLAVIAAVAIHNIFENLHVLSMGVQLSTIWAFLVIVAQPAWSPPNDSTAAPAREGR